MFNTGFQSSSAIAKNMEYCIGTLTANPDFLEELRKELDGKVRLAGGIKSPPARDPLEVSSGSIPRYLSVLP